MDYSWPLSLGLPSNMKGEKKNHNALIDGEERFSS